MTGSEIQNRFEDNFRASRFRKSENTRTDCRHRDARKLILFGQNKSVTDCGFQQRILMRVSSLPYRSNRVDHVSRRQRAGAGYRSLARGHAADPVAFLLNDEASLSDDRTRNAASVLKPFICGVHDRIHALSGDITLHDFDAKARLECVLREDHALPSSIRITEQDVGTASQ